MTKKFVHVLFVCVLFKILRNSTISVISISLSPTILNLRALRDRAMMLTLLVRAITTISRTVCDPSGYIMYDVAVAAARRDTQTLNNDEILAFDRI